MTDDNEQSIPSRGSVAHPLAESLRDMSDKLNACGNDFSDILLDAARELDRRRWIPVTERLPELLTEVLGWHPADRVRAWFRHSGQPLNAPYWEQWEPQDRECDDCNVKAPTHWMPLPAPPTDGK